MTRLYHPGNLLADRFVNLSEGQTHYLRHVLRASVDYQLAVFNEREGEWLARLTALSKTIATVMVEKRLRPAVMGPDVALMFAPIKHDPLTFLVEKATELGARHFYPVMTERCNISRVNPARLTSNMVEASQQCERFDIPALHPLAALNKALGAWRASVPLLVCQERSEAPPIRGALQGLPPKAPIGFLIGPEGGFSPQEIAGFRGFPFIRFASLGCRILRAETAALAAIACYQALVGDWGNQ